MPHLAGQLEPRRLLSATLDEATGLLLIQGSEKNDAIDVALDPSGSSLVVTEQAIPNGSPRVVSFDASAVSSIRISSFGGDDRITVAVSVPTVVNAGDGDDLVAAGGAGDTLRGDAGSDSLLGNGGRDRLDGGPGNDSLAGGSGNDVLTGGVGDNTLRGGSGSDTADYSSRLAGVILNLAHRSGGRAVHLDDSGTLAYGDSLRTIENAYGTDGEDVFTGNDLPNHFILGGGSDTVLAGPGDDTVFGYAGDDSLRGGPGNDVIFGDFPQGFAGFRNANGSNNTGLSRDGRDLLFGDAGNDRIVGGRTYSVTNISPYDRTELFESGQISTISSGDDPADNDFISGGTGDDTLDGGSGLDGLNGDAGIDTVDYSLRSTDLSLTINGGSSDGEVIGTTRENDNINASEHAIGGSGDDFIEGTDSFTNLLIGGGGNDTLRGRAGNDTLLGGDGDDSLEGNDGNDSLVGGVGIDTLFRGAGNDVLDDDENDQVI